MTKSTTGSPDVASRVGQAALYAANVSILTGGSFKRHERAT